LGTPPQNIETLFDDSEEDTYVRSSDAQDDPSEPQDSGCGGAVPSGGASPSGPGYNESASSSAQANGQDFQSYWGDSGHVTNDAINLNGLQASVNVGVVDRPTGDSWVSYIDGVLGLATSSQPSSNVSVLAQIADSLDQPIVTILSREQGQITIGALDTENCEAEYATAPKYSGWNVADLSSIQLGDSTLPAEDAIVWVESWLPQIYVGQSLLDALINATDAHEAYISGDSDETGYSYYGDDVLVVDCAQVSTLPNIVLTIGNGPTPGGLRSSQVTITPADYVEPNDSDSSDDAICLLAVADHGLRTDDVLLGLPFTDNNCIANNIKEQTLGISRVKAAKAQA